MSRQEGDLPTLLELLRQMLAALDAERQALAAVDLEALIAVTGDKRELCTMLEANIRTAVGGEAMALLESAKRQNEINRKVRNLLAANVEARLDRLSPSAGLYTARTRRTC